MADTHDDSPIAMRLWMLRCQGIDDDAYGTDERGEDKRGEGVFRLVGATVPLGQEQVQLVAEVTGEEHQK